MLELKYISKQLGDFRLNEVNLAVGAAEYFTLLGPTGVGKTIVLEIIAGLIRPDTGSVLWNGRDITRLPPENRGFALMYQEYALFPHMSVADNIGYPLRRTHNRAARAGRIGELAEQVSITHLLDRRPINLSGGEKQRVALARALAAEPQLLLLDEPLSALDLNVRDRLRGLLRHIHQSSGATILHVTHDVDEALALGQRIGIMLDGRLQQVGPPEEVFVHPTDRRAAEFLGLKNILPVDEVRDERCKVNGVEVDLPGIDPGVRFIWLRPEEIILSRQPFDSSARNQFRCTVQDWEHSAGRLAVRVMIGRLPVTVMITHASHREMAIEPGLELFCTFKSTAVHWF